MTSYITLERTKKVLLRFSGVTRKVHHCIKVVLWLRHKCKVSCHTTSNVRIATTEVIRHAYIKNISLGKEMLTSKVNDTFFRVLSY